MENLKEKKILTLSVPTWNRASYLKELLAQLTEQIKKFGLEDKIEILVSNNDSTDNTEEIVKSFQTAFPFITYNKNYTNIGAKSNVIKSMERANSEFVMVLGDDDRIRMDVLPDLLNILSSTKDLGIFIDTAKAKNKSHSRFTPELLLKQYFWYIGNAGVFVMRTHFVKENIQKYGYDFFNECWPQTQFMILGLNSQRNLFAYTGELGIISESLHDNVMIYTSFYIWRTCYFDLRRSINDIKNLVPNEIGKSARQYMMDNITQQMFNILQLGVFVDEKETRKITLHHIIANINMFSTYEKLFLLLIIFTLWLPTFISRPLSDFFILAKGGKAALQKKNVFVKSEHLKKINHSTGIRKLEFEK